MGPSGGISHPADGSRGWLRAASSLLPLSLMPTSTPSPACRRCLGPEDLHQVVHRAVKPPHRSRLVSSPQQQLAKPLHLFDVPEHRLHCFLPPIVPGPAPS